MPADLISVGDVVSGRYRLDKKLGPGGFADVYRATQLDTDDEVVVKVLHGGLASDVLFQLRFQREGQILAALDHPRIVGFREQNSHDHRPILVMDLIQGKDLRDAKSDEPDFPLAIQIAVQLAETLSYIHERGIIHRDVTTRNIILDPDGESVLIDFGIALAARCFASPGLTIDGLRYDSRLTQPGRSVGTVNYASPEVVIGAWADHRADIYSLGVVMYELACGTRPFTQESGINTLKLGRRVIHEIPRPPRMHNPDIPPILEEIILKCLAKEPGGRFRSAEDLLWALEFCQSEITVGPRA